MIYQASQYKLTSRGTGSRTTACPPRPQLAAITLGPEPCASASPKEDDRPYAPRVTLRHRAVLCRVAMPGLTHVGNPGARRAEPTWGPARPFRPDRSYVPCAGQRYCAGPFSGCALEHRPQT